ncbi:MAG: hypothetical protein WCH13_02045 [Deltaproteobacteria bacterium]
MPPTTTSTAQLDPMTTPLGLVAEELLRVEARIRDLTVSREPQLQAIATA